MVSPVLSTHGLLSVVAALLGTTVISVTALQPSLEVDFSSFAEPCPVPYTESIYQNNWTTYHNIDRLSWCNQTQLLSFSLYNPVNSSHVSIRSTIHLPASSAGAVAAPSILGGKDTGHSFTTKCGISPNSTHITLREASWGAEDADAVTVKQVLEAGKQIRNLLLDENQCDTNITFAYAGVGDVAVGVYVGGLVKNSAAVDVLVQKLLTTVEARGIKERLLYQYCGEDALYTVGIVADLSDANLVRVQQTMRSWNEGDCVDVKGSFGADISSKLLTFPRPPPDLMPLYQSNVSQALNATYANTTTSGSLTNSSHTHNNISRRHTSLHYRHGVVLQARATCSSYKKIVAGDTCGTLVTKCGITAAQLASYNPSSTFCSTLQVNQVICCSAGTPPNLTPPAAADGSCASYQKVVSGDDCGKLVTRCGITTSQFTTYNAQTNLCSTLALGQVVCCSPGKLPDLSPKPQADGTCATVAVRDGDYCAALATTYYLTPTKIETLNKQTWGWMGCLRLQIGQKICLSTGRPPMPAAVVNTVCGPQVPGTLPPSGATPLASLNPCPLNSCCNIWGQCGTTSDFCTPSSADTGAPGTAAPGSNGCISNCGTDIVNNGGPPASFMRIGYYESWNFERPCLHMAISQIDTSKYTHLHFAFATITTDYKVNIAGVEAQFARFAALKGVKRILSFGGWTFSTSRDTYAIFREAVTDANRNLFADNCVQFLLDSGLDGLDFDWEYPGAPDTNSEIPPASPADGMNYAKFLGRVRTGLNARAPGKSLSVAMPASYWYLKGFPVGVMAPILDYVVFMAYDLHGQYDYGNKWAQAGCPLGNCLRHQTNLTETINALSMVTKAGMPANKIIVGVTSYGRSFKMSAAGCTSPQCTYTGTAKISNARIGRCTGTAGWLGDGEIREILRTNPSASTQFGQTSQSDIMIYNMTEWVGYMSPSTKAIRRSLYQGLNMGGTVDWAVSLGDVEVDSSVDEGGGSIGTTTIRHRSPALATVMPYQATTVAGTATFSITLPLASEMSNQAFKGDQNSPVGPGSSNCGECDLARLITSTCCGVGGGVRNPIVILPGVPLPQPLVLPKGFVPGQEIVDSSGGYHGAGTPIAEEITISQGSIFRYRFDIPPGLLLVGGEDHDDYEEEPESEDGTVTLYIVSTFWQTPGPYSASCNSPCKLVFPPLTKTTTWTPPPFVTTKGASSTSVVLPPYTTQKIQLTPVIIQSSTGASPTKVIKPLPGLKPLCITVTLPILGTITFGICPPNIQPFPPPVPVVTIFPPPPGTKAGPTNVENRPTPDQEKSEDPDDEDDDEDEDEDDFETCSLDGEPLDDGLYDFFDDFQNGIDDIGDWGGGGGGGAGGGASGGAGIGTPKSSVVTVTTTRTITSGVVTTTAQVTVTVPVSKPTVPVPSPRPVDTPKPIPDTDEVRCYDQKHGLTALRSRVEFAIVLFCYHLFPEIAGPTVLVLEEQVQVGWYRTDELRPGYMVVLTYQPINGCTFEYDGNYDTCLSTFSKGVRDCVAPGDHNYIGPAIIRNNCMKAGISFPTKEFLDHPCIWADPGPNPNPSAFHCFKVEYNIHTDYGQIWYAS